MNLADGESTVLIVTDAYPPDCGGSGWSTHALVAQLKEAGQPVAVLQVETRDAGPPLMREFDGVRIETLPIGRHRVARRHLRTADFSLAPVRSGVRAFLEGRPDIGLVHGQHLHSGPGAAWAARDTGRAAVVTIRDMWPIRLDSVAWPDETEDTVSQRRLAGRALVRGFGVHPVLASLAAGQGGRRLRVRQRSLEMCQRVICVSEAVRRRLAVHVAAELVVVPNMISTERSAESADRGEPVAGVVGPYLFAAGKLNSTKGFDLLVDELAAAGCRWPLVVAGSGPLESAMDATARRAGLQLVQLGWTNGDSLLRAAREARAVIVPSVLEDALPRVILESMSVGTPAVARVTGGSPEAIEHGVDGFLYTDTPGLREALDSLEDDDRAAALGRAALRACERRFAPEIVLDQLLAVYREARAATTA